MVGQDLQAIKSFSTTCLFLPSLVNGSKVFRKIVPGHVFKPLYYFNLRNRTGKSYFASLMNIHIELPRPVLIQYFCLNTFFFVCWDNLVNFYYEKSQHLLSLFKKMKTCMTSTRKPINLRKAKKLTVPY